MGNEGRVIIFFLISTGKSCGPAGEEMARGRTLLYASKGGLRDDGEQGLLSKPGSLPLTG